MQDPIVHRTHPSVYMDCHTTIPNEIHDNPNLSILAKALLWYWLRNANCPEMSYDLAVIQQHLGCTKNELEGLFIELEKEGYAFCSMKGLDESNLRKVRQVAIKPLWRKM